MLDFILISFIMSAGIYVATQLLTEKDKVFGFVKGLKLPLVIKKPLYSCALCSAGQWSLWISILWLHSFDVTNPKVLIKQVVVLFGQVLLTMFFTYTIEKWRARF